MNGPQLKRVLGSVQLLFYGVGVIVGAGVYSVIGAAAGEAGETLWLSFLLGAVVALFTGLSYAEMATSFPHAGAEYVYLREALPRSPWASFGTGFVILVSGAATATTVAVAFGGYVGLFLDVPVVLSAAALLLACTGLNVLGMQESSWVNMLFTTAEVLGLALVIGVGITAPEFGEAILSAPHGGTLAGAALIFFVYLGFQQLANMVEEVRDPPRDIPRAITISLGITTVLYVLVALAVVALTASEELAESEAPLAAAVRAAAPRLAGALGAIALFSTANTVLITLLATSRLAFAMGRDGEIPPIFARLRPGRGTPWLASLVLLAASLALLPLGGVEAIGGLSSFSALLAFLVVNAALILLRFSRPEQKRPFRVPLAIGRLPVLPVFGIATAVLLLSSFDSPTYLAGGTTVLLGFVLYWLRPCWMQRRNATTRHARAQESTIG